MIRAHILVDDTTLVGSIHEDRSGFRISWRERSEDYSHPVSTTENSLYVSIEEARQGVYKTVPNATINEV